MVVRCAKSIGEVGWPLDLRQQLEGAPGGGVAAMAYQAGRAGGATLKEFSEAAARAPLKFQPGTGYAYGTSIDILGRYT